MKQFTYLPVFKLKVEGNPRLGSFFLSVIVINKVQDFDPFDQSIPLRLKLALIKEVTSQWKSDGSQHYFEGTAPVCKTS